MAAFALGSIGVPAIYAGGVNSGVITRRASMRLATRLGRTEETGRQWYKAALLQEPSKADVDLLLASKKVFAPYMMQGTAAVTLAQNHALLPVYAIPGLALSPTQLDPLLASLHDAQYVFLTRAEYDGLMAASKSRFATQSPTAMRRPTSGSDDGFYAMETGFPLRTHAANLVYEPTAVLGNEIKRDWEIARASGAYVILRRRP
jgi:hypothetical protein